jgi:hypothetical protein
MSKFMEHFKAPKRVKYFFWLVLGVLSTVVPEVIAGSDLYPFFKITDYFIVIPLYTLHSLVLSYIIWNWGNPRIYNLFPAGAIFGLYEAYMTKVIWNPSWSEFPLKIFGIAIFETLILVIFWHAFLAFIVPLLIAESMTSSREIVNGFPNWISKWFKTLRKWNKYLILPLIAGLFQSINTPTIKDSILSGLTSTFITIAIILLWRKTSGPSYSFRTLMPTSNEFRILLSSLLIMYILMGIFWRPEALPGVFPQITVWILYLLFGTLLYTGLMKSRNDNSKSQLDFDISTRNLFTFGVLFVIGSIFGKATGLSFIAVYSVWLGGIIFGLYFLFRILYMIFITKVHM